MSLLLALQTPGGPVNRTDSLSVGNYVVSGKTIIDSVSRSDALSAGTYVVSGKTVTDVLAKNDNLSVGSYLVPGKTVSDSVVRADLLSVGAYTVSGKTVSDVVARADALSVGNYVVSGKDITDVITGGNVNYADSLLVGSYTVTSYSVVDVYARNDNLSVGSYVASGKDITDDLIQVLTNEFSGGSGYPVYGKYERPKSVGEFLDVAMSEIYEAGTDKELPIETREAFAKIVKPYTKAKAKIPDVEKIDWATFESDITRIEQMIALWEQVLEEEDLIIMAYLQYHY
jgi:hypothetical protein